MKRLLLLLPLLLIFFSGTTLKAMDQEVLATRIDKDIVEFINNQSFLDNVKTFYESKQAESTEYKQRLLLNLFAVHTCLAYKYHALEYLSQQIDLIDPDKSRINFETQNSLLSHFVEFQSPDGHGNLFVIRPLLEWCINRGAPINGGTYRTSPLAVAINIGHEQVVDLLLEHNANVHMVVDGQTLLNFAHTTQQQIKTHPAERKAILDAIIDHALSPAALFAIRDQLKGNGIIDFVNQMLQYTDYEGFIIRRLLSFCASLNGAAQEIQLLIDRTTTNDTILNNEDCNELLYNLIQHYPGGDDAGMMSVRSTLPQWIAWCIRHGAPVDIPEADGMTPLMLAVAGGGRNQVGAYDDVVKVLMDNNANPDQQCTLGDGTYTPKSFLDRRLEKYKLPENIRAKALLTKTTTQNTPPLDPNPQKSHSLSLPKIGLLCAGTIVTYLALHKLYAWLYPETDDETEDADTEKTAQENTAEADIVA